MGATERILAEERLLIRAVADAITQYFAIQEGSRENIRQAELPEKRSAGFDESFLAAAYPQTASGTDTQRDDAGAGSTYLNRTETRIAQAIERFYGNVQANETAITALLDKERAREITGRFRQNRAQALKTTVARVLGVFEACLDASRNALETLKTVREAVERRLRDLQEMSAANCRQANQYMVLSLYKAMGYGQFVYLNEGDTCEDCARLDGMVYAIEKGRVGENLPPMHINCDCYVGIVGEGGKIVAVIGSELDTEKWDALLQRKNLLLGENYRTIPLPDDLLGTGIFQLLSIPFLVWGGTTIAYNTSIEGLYRAIQSILRQEDSEYLLEHWTHMAWPVIKELLFAAFTEAFHPIQREENYSINRQVGSITERIEDQSTNEAIAQMRYGDFSFDMNGCEVIAVHNAMVELGRPQELRDVIYYFDGRGSILNGAFGTNPLAAIPYFQEHGYQVTVETNPSNFDELAQESKVCILTYKNIGQTTVHTVMLKKQSNRKIYVYNINGPRKVFLSVSQFLAWNSDLPIIMLGIR